MKYFIFFSIVINSWNCVSCKRNEAKEAYFHLKKLEMKPLLNFGMDTRGVNDSGQLIVRSIRYWSSKASYLVYPKIDTISLKRFCEKQNFTLIQLDSLIYALLKHHSCTNASEIISTPQLGEFVYYTFEHDNNVLVYCPNVTKIYNSYWRKNINNDNKIDSSWYIVKRE